MSHENGTQLAAEYRNSWALIIGINSYRHLPPLSYAVNDAQAIANVLSERFNFAAQRILYLENQEATREAILSVFDKTLTDKKLVTKDDRLLIFFAGHGFTRHGSQGHVGFIAPADARRNAWRSLIAISDLTEVASFVPAKHIFFIMDACYSGLSLSRGGSLEPYIERMLTREAWQVLTAGKADEVVADGGGPRGRNSIFTSYLLDAFNGAAAEGNGLLTANSVMSYVYRQVIADPRSRQTPHFGWLRGDGDFVFHKPLVAALPTALGVALEQGGVESRKMVVNALAKIAVVEDKVLSQQAVRKLEDLAENDPAREVRLRAARELRPAGASGLREALLAGDTIVHRRRSARRTKRLWSAITALALLAFGLGLFGLRSRSSAARAQDEVFVLQTQSANVGAMAATLMANVEATLTPSPAATATSEEPDLSVRESLVPDFDATLVASAMPTSSPTPTVGLQETEAASTSEAIRDSEVIFADEFSGNGGGWELSDAGVAVRSIEDGRLQFWVNDNYTLWASRPDLVQQADFILSVDASVLEGEGSFSFGLIFRQIDFDNYYYFLFSNQGSVLAIKQFGGEAGFLLEPTQVPDNLVEPGEPVRLAVLAVGSQFTFFVNGQQVAAAEDLSFASGRLGVAVQTLGDVPVVVGFDNLLVQLPR